MTKLQLVLGTIVLMAVALRVLFLGPREGYKTEVESAWILTHARFTTGLTWLRYNYLQQRTQYFMGYAPIQMWYRTAFVSFSKWCVCVLFLDASTDRKQCDYVRGRYLQGKGWLSTDSHSVILSDWGSGCSRFNGIPVYPFSLSKFWGCAVSISHETISNQTREMYDDIWNQQLCLCCF